MWLEKYFLCGLKKISILATEKITPEGEKKYFDHGKTERTGNAYITITDSLVYFGQDFVDGCGQWQAVTTKWCLGESIPKCFPAVFTFLPLLVYCKLLVTCVVLQI